MSLELSIQLGVIPALLIVLAGMLFRYVTGNKLFLFWLVLGATLGVSSLIIGQIAGNIRSSQLYSISYLLSSPMIGTLALVLINLKQLGQLSRRGKVLASLLVLVLLASLVGSWLLSGEEIIVILLPSLLVLVFVWALCAFSDNLSFVFSIAALGLLTLYDSMRLITPNQLWPLGWLKPLLFFCSIVLAVTMPAMLISSTLKRLARSENVTRSLWFPILVRWGLALLLLGYLAYTIVWASIWDQATDGLGGLFISIQASITAIAAGMLLGAAHTGWRRLVGLAFAVLVPVLMSWAFRYGWDVPYHKITEARAARVQRAVERFHTRNGHYPAELQELVPRDLLWISGPIIRRVTDWCYQGDQDNYWLSSFYNEFFGLPFSLRIYASSGTPPEPGWVCEEKLAAFKEQHDPRPMYEHEIAPSLPEKALPTSVVPIQRIPVQPLVRAKPIYQGSWSPNAEYLLFSFLESFSDPPSTVLNFLNDNGDICQATERYSVESRYLRRRHVWLSDGRLLFISDEGEIDLLKPCVDGKERLTDRYAEKFIEVAAHEAQSGRILLKSQEAFWLLDGDTLQAQQISEVSPNPYDAHRDNSVWLPGGEKLAISRLNGRDKTTGSTLYIVDGETGAVLEQLPLEHASDQSAPNVEWLTKDELLLHGSELVVIDFRSEPPKFTNVLKDIFALDIDYPYEISTMATLPDQTKGIYHLMVRVNHPRNQDSYVYHSENAQVEILSHDTNTLVFSNNECIELRKMSEEPSFQDEYEQFWIDVPAKESRRLVVQGHTPRIYPILHTNYLPRRVQMVFSSSQGISLVSIPDGELLYFWELVDGQDSRSVYARATLDEKSLVVYVGEVGLYFIPLPDP